MTTQGIATIHLPSGHVYIYTCQKNERIRLAKIPREIMLFIGKPMGRSIVISAKIPLWLMAKVFFP